ncbi:uncharacterized protein HMPREF1541_01634 [Cyphellophora europaea CBS 101466]|uniref:Uncharacterized protein n=1 Tax=Cyphellophora europaea (strain CBS 101466) TaxID=1220924 RepID=W2S368_CYPE1|nr:uncharacterized protein HMPREF1541_01634 [Cyphellophora europaea CBS 101466]ETN42478.1 hypothetical protein HMPREF1541_01634 [Cyphellophora europaea CBS 101466]
MIVRALLGLALLPCLAVASFVKTGSDCHIVPQPFNEEGHAQDDSPFIKQAFDECGHDGRVIFEPGVFNIEQVLNTTGLVNCDVVLKGELRFSDDIPYWLKNSIWVIYQNQHTAWLFGGENVTFTTEEGGFHNGNGQAWYTQNRNRANQPGRPISMTFYRSKNLTVDGLSFIQPQFWAVHVWESEQVVLRNIYITATSNDQWGTVNTDGADTWNSRDVLFENWDVTNGDDCIAVKGNSTNITIRNATCHHGNGMTIGSVGEYPEWPDYVENILFEDVKLFGTEEGAYIKIWQGEPSGDSDNGAGGGGGSGYVKNVTFRNFELTDVPLPIQISQCIYTEGSGKCDSSKMQVANITWENFKGTSRFNIAASIHCVKTHPCPGLYFKDVDLKSVNETLGLPLTNTDLPFEVFQCANIVNQNSTSNIPCNWYAPNNFNQHVNGNIRSSEYEQKKAVAAGNVLEKVKQLVWRLSQSLLRPFI